MSSINGASLSPINGGAGPEVSGPAIRASKEDLSLASGIITDLDISLIKSVLLRDFVINILASQMEKTREETAKKFDEEQSRMVEERVRFAEGMKNLSDRVDCVVREKEAAERQVAECTASLEGLKGELAQKIEINETLDGMTKTDEDAIKNLKDQLSEVQETLKKAQEEKDGVIEVMSCECSTLKAELTGKVKRLSADITAKDAEVAKLRATIEKKDGEIASLRAAIAPATVVKNATLKGGRRLAL